MQNPPSLVEGRALVMRVEDETAMAYAISWVVTASIDTSREASKKSQTGAKTQNAAARNKDWVQIF